ncbi:MAG TPA: cytochrome bd-I oxidase subunit CydX [Pseudomonadales bacterium]|nr:cytochrome bd-I oxidase subunit CydX [Pseudomonadales bacterium]
MACIKEAKKWYFTWILGVLLACSFGIINAMWLETEHDLDCDEDAR